MRRSMKALLMNYKNGYSIEGKGSENFHLQDKSWMLRIEYQQRSTRNTNWTRVLFAFNTIRDRISTTGNQNH